MLTVTEPAKQVLKSLLETNSEQADAGLRMLRTETNELSLTIDMEKAGDNVVEHEGSKVLIVDAPLADEMQDITLDIQERPDGVSLVLMKNPEEV